LDRDGPIRWPARSPVLNPLDFFLMGILQEKNVQAASQGRGRIK